MALTVTSQAEGPGKAGTRPLFSANPRAASVWFGSVAFDSTYPTGGEAFDAEAESGFSSVFFVLAVPTGGFTFEYVDSDTAANRKIKAYWVDTTVDGAALAEVPNDTDVDALTAVPVMVVGYR